MSVSNVMGLGVPTLSVCSGGVTTSVCISRCINSMEMSVLLDVDRVSVIGFTPVPGTRRVLACERDPQRLVDVVNDGIPSSQLEP